MVLNNYIRAFWYSSNNFGDNLNYYLIKRISGKEPVLCYNRNERHFIVCGSILSEANRFTTVWGAGFGSDHQFLSIDPENILAVRGELSKKKVNKPIDAVGDPALLMPMFYTTKIEKKHRLGIIPHWKDLEMILFASKDVKVINPLQDPLRLIDELMSCENILSSSLHGLIFADTYGVPNKWLSLGTDIDSDWFKFKDYYSTTNYPAETPTSDINFSDFKIHKYKFNLDTFLKSCPFA